MSLDTLERLLRPISPSSPCGESVRYEPVFLEIRLEREEDDPSLPMGVWERPLKRANWPLVAQRCAELIEKRSKDLQLAAWLTDAWVRIDQVEGLSRGLQLLHGLLLHYWELVHPAIDDGDVDARLAAFEWLNECVPMTLRLHVPLAHLPDRKPSTISMADWDRMTATELAAADTPEGQADEANPAAPAQLTRSMVVAYSHGYGQAAARKLRDDVESALTALQHLEALIRQKVGELQAPSLAGIQRTLVHLQRIVAQLLAAEASAPTHTSARPEPEMNMTEATGVDSEGPMTVAEELQASPTGVSMQGWRSREEAYRTLEALADYLGRVEPHSPTPYLIRRAVTWGRMELPELMAEIVREEGDLNRLISLLGLPRQ